MCNCYGLTRVTDRCTDICNSLSTYYSMRDNLMSQVTMTPLNLRYKVADVTRKISSEILTQLDLITYNLKTLHSKYIVAERPGYEMLEAHPPSVKFSFPDDPRLLKEYTAGTRTVTAPKMPEMTPVPEKLTVYPVLESVMASSVMVVSVKGSYASPDYSDGSNDYHAQGYVWTLSPGSLPITYKYRYFCYLTDQGYIPIHGTYHRFQLDATPIETGVCEAEVKVVQTVRKMIQLKDQYDNILCNVYIAHNKASAKFVDLEGRLPKQGSDVVTYHIDLDSLVAGGCDRVRYIYISGITYELLRGYDLFLIIMRPGDQYAFEQPLHMMLVIESFVAE